MHAKINWQSFRRENLSKVTESYFPRGGFKERELGCG